MCRGTTGTLERQGDQTYGGWFDVGAAVLVTGQSMLEAREVAQRYQGAMNALVLQHGDLGGFATDTVLLGFTVDLQAVDNRYVALAVSQFHSFIDEIVTASYGPILPNPAELTPDPTAPPGSTESPYSGFPEATSYDVTLTED